MIGKENGMKLKTRFATYDNLFLTVDRYRYDNSTAVQLWNYTDGPIARLTVCLDDKSLDEDEAYLDTNNLPEAVDFVKEYGLGELTGDFRRSGWCVYPKVKFNMDELEKYAARRQAATDFKRR